MYNEYLKGMPMLCDHMGWNSQYLSVECFNLSWQEPELWHSTHSLDSDKDFGKVVETSVSITDNSPSQGYPLALKTDLFRKFINELFFSITVKHHGIFLYE